MAKKSLSKHAQFLHQNMISSSMQPPVFLGHTMALFSLDGESAGTDTMQMRVTQCNFGIKTKEHLSTDAD